ncbi:MAG: hypothetical protein ACKOPN_00590, partial [Prochlorococcaceae cyanobacterium]
MGWSTLLESHDFDDWQRRVGHLLGPHDSRIQDGLAHRRFRQRIRAAAVGPVALVAFEGGGSFLLERIQPADRAVLWLPTQGVIQETVERDTLVPEPGMALWIRPGTALRGSINGACSGLSIILPLTLLQLDQNQPWCADAGAGPMLLNPFGR